MLADGVPVSVVTTETPFSESAARRHIRLHLRPHLLSDLRTADSGLNLADFSTRLLELVDEAARVRSWAMSTNAPKLALSAIAEERATLVTLMQRLGIDSTEAAEIYSDSTALTRALAALLRSGALPGLPALLADRLEEFGLNEFARRVRDHQPQPALVESENPYAPVLSSGPGRPGGVPSTSGD